MKRPKLKIALLSFLLIAGMGKVSAQVKDFVIQGTVKGIPDQKVYLSMVGAGPDEKAQVVDVVRGKFSFKGKLKTPPALMDIKFEDKQYWMSPRSAGLPIGSVLVDNGEKINYSVSVDPKNVQTNAGYVFPDIEIKTTYPEFVELRRVNQELLQKFDQYELKAIDDLSAYIKDSLRLDLSKQKEKDLDAETKLKLLKARTKWMVASAEVSKGKREYTIDYINKYPNSIVSMIQIYKTRGRTPLVSGLFDKLDQRIKSSAVAAAYFKEIEDAKTVSKSGAEVAKGKAFKDFNTKDMQGNDLKFASLLKEGEYVLLDFWASWCSPCRAENPNLLKAHNRFKDKGLKIVAVSLDNSKAAWLKAVKEDGMPFLHLSHLKGFDSEAAKLYGINAIPANFLIDSKGNIVAKGLKKEELQTVLAGIFDK